MILENFLVKLYKKYVYINNFLYEKHNDYANIVYIGVGISLFFGIMLVPAWFLIEIAKDSVINLMELGFNIQEIKAIMLFCEYGIVFGVVLSCLGCFDNDNNPNVIYLNKKHIKIKDKNNNIVSMSLLLFLEKIERNDVENIEAFESGRVFIKTLSFNISDYMGLLDITKKDCEVVYKHIIMNCSEIEVLKKEFYKLIGINNDTKCTN